MQRLPGSPLRFQLGLRGWAAVTVGLAIFASLTVLVGLLAFGIFIVAVPLFLFAPLTFHFRGKPLQNGQENPAPESAISTNEHPAVIEHVVRLKVADV
jgi:hypothetical protein